MDYGEYREIIDALIAKKNDLIATGHYTDAIDEILIKLSRAKQKKVKVIYTA
jgi:tRNA U34 2-thiouridine synthase MnmA/TrmU